MHIRFKGFTDLNHKIPVEKVIPIDMIGLQKWGTEPTYWIEVYYYQTQFKEYNIDRKEYDRISGLLV